MKAELIRIGNSQGIASESSDRPVRARSAVEMRVEGESLIITQAKDVLSGWDEALKAMAEQGDDAALIPDDLEHSSIGPSGSGELAQTIRGLAGLARSDKGLGDRKTRPCVVVSPDEMNRNIATVIVAPITTATHPIRPEFD